MDAVTRKERGCNGTTQAMGSILVERHCRDKNHPNARKFFPEVTEGSWLAKAGRQFAWPVFPTVEREKSQRRGLFWHASWLIVLIGKTVTHATGIKRG